jgi:DNA-binding NarL/FixJ family response regulator
MKILVVDDHVLIREAMRSVLNELDGTAAILEAPDGAAAMKLIEQHDDLGLVLLDLSLPDRNGFSLLSDLRELRPGVSVVVMSAREEGADVRRALDLGAMGFIPKSAQRDVLLGALRLVFAGGIYIPPQILARDGPAVPPKPADRRGADGGATPAELGLTGRQLAVLALMAQGKSNKEICRALDISEATVKNHVTAILKALRARNRTEAVIAVGELGWDLATAAK